jgi:hypothetical protein
MLRPPWLKIGAGLAIVAGVGFGVWSYNSAITRAAKAEARVTSLEADVAAGEAAHHRRHAAAQHEDAVGAA